MDEYKLVLPEEIERLEKKSLDFHQLEESGIELTKKQEKEWFEITKKLTKFYNENPEYRRKKINKTFVIFIDLN